MIPSMSPPTGQPTRRPLSAHLRRQRLKRIIGGAVVAPLVVFLIIADQRGWLRQTSSEQKRYDGKTFRVARVIDGDTLDLDVPDGDKPTTRVRLWGIDTPELARPSEKKPADPFANEAASYARALALSQDVIVRIEPHQVRDKYERLLAYIELPDRSLLNERLIEKGLAKAVPEFPHRLMDRFAIVEEDARKAKRGMWAK